MTRGKAANVTAVADVPNERIGGYLRKSQVVWPEGCDSLEQRAAYIEELRRVRMRELEADAARHGKRITLWYDDMGVSGQGKYLDKRVALARLRQDARAGALSLLFARDLSRLFRDLIGQEVFFLEMERLGCRVVAADLPVSDKGSSNAMMRQIVGAVNQQRAVDMGETIVLHQRAAVESGVWIGSTKPLWGLRYDPAAKDRLLYDPATAPRAIALFERFVAEGGVAHRVAAALNEGVKAGDGSAFAAPGGGWWDAKAVLRLIRNPRYRRAVVWGEAEMPRPDQIPEVVPAALVKAAQELAAARAQPPGARGHAGRRDYTYSGGVICGHCGGPVKAMGRAPSPGAYNPSGVVYMCRAARASHPRCPDSRGIGQARLDALVAEALRAALRASSLAGGSPPSGSAPAPKAHARKTKDGKAAWRSQAALLAALDEEERRCRQLYKEGITPTMAELLADLARVEEKRRLLEEREKKTREKRTEETGGEGDVLPALTPAQWRLIQAGLDALWQDEGRAALARDAEKAALLSRLSARLTLQALPRLSIRKRLPTGGRARLRLEMPALGFVGESAIVVTEREDQRRKLGKGGAYCARATTCNGSAGSSAGRPTR